MKRSIAAAAALAVFAVPAGAAAAPSDEDRTNAAKECRTERGSTDATREAFRVKYGTNKNGKNAFGKCVSRRAKAEESEGETAKSNAAKECKDERAEIGQQPFAEKYGTNQNGKNAYGKCVSSQAKENEGGGRHTRRREVQGAPKGRQGLRRGAQAWGAKRSPRSTAPTPTTATPSASACRRSRRPSWG